MDRKPKIALACQGGGSQTAFTAGALSHLLRVGVQREFEIVSLSGASGGAICAALAWCALHLREAEPWARVEAFWADNTAQWPTEVALNQATLSVLRWVSQGHIPSLHTTPYALPFKAALGALALATRPEYTNLERLLAKHLDVEAMARFPREAPPVLLVGAVDTLSGRMEEFTSREEPIKVCHLMASAAVPELFPAVDVGDGGAYWDGLFSDNPPIGELVRDDIVGRDNIPDEIWVIKINPTRRAKVPTVPDDITDRRNELYGNISLFHQLAAIAKTNELFMADAFRPEFLEQWHIKHMIRIPRSYDHDPEFAYHIPCIEMSHDLQESLDYESKLDRSPGQMRRLMADGQAQAAAFLRERAAITPAA